MSESDSKGVTLIGLHTLSPTGEGSAPELKVLMSRQDIFRRDPNVIAFPHGASRPPGEIPPACFGRDAATGRNVVAFAVPEGKSSGRRRTV